MLCSSNVIITAIWLAKSSVQREPASLSSCHPLAKGPYEYKHQVAIGVVSRETPIFRVLILCFAGPKWIILKRDDPKQRDAQFSGTFGGLCRAWNPKKPYRKICFVNYGGDEILPSILKGLYIYTYFVYTYTNIWICIYIYIYTYNIHCSLSC